MSVPAHYTSGGSPLLERRLDDLCLRAGEGCRAIVPAARLEALLLGGGYGRGEGGVLRREGSTEDEPYNDMEFFVCIQGSVPLNEYRYSAAVEALGHRLTDEIGIEVEFKIISLARLRNSETTMFFYDLASGHRLAPCGGTADEAAVRTACAPHLDAARIPLHEAARLLLNRCSGLLFAAERLRRGTFAADETDFTARNLAKAQLGLGDVLLTALGRYHWSCRERSRRLTEEPDSVFEFTALPLPEIRAWHREGVEFKLRPCISSESRGTLAARHRELKAGAWAVWQWLEERRLGLPVVDPEHYSADSATKCPETSEIKNALVRLRALGLSAWSRDAIAGRAMRYPREALFRTLPLLLWRDVSFETWDAALLSSLLHAPVKDWQDAVGVYERLWRRFN